MTAMEYCGGCDGTPSPECAGSLARASVVKAHWECWSACNLGCGFCFRTKAIPLETGAAGLAIRSLSTGGVSRLVFAGGDPSLRPDLVELVNLSREVGLGVEIQTNAQIVRSQFLEAMLLADRVGLSLDAPTADLHDSLRGRRGNFRRVISLLETLTARGVPVAVRTVVSARNVHAVPAIGQLLSRYEPILKWRLLEFTAVEGGWDNRRDYDLPKEEFDAAVTTAAEVYCGAGYVDSLSTLDKVGAYMMMAPDGKVYGTTHEAYFVTGRHRYIGALHQTHLADLAAVLPINRLRHQARYGSHL